MSEELTPTEREALHHLQLGRDHLYRAYGRLLDFHHAVGRSTDHLDDAARLFREAEREEAADDIEAALPTGAVEEQWTFELCESFETGFLTDMTTCEEHIRDAVADGDRHIAERRQQEEWRDRP